MNLFEEAKTYIPGGVNSPVRAWGAIGADPEFIHSAKGKYLTTESGKTMVDFCSSWGAIILGHAADPVIAAVTEQIAKGTSYGAPTIVETELAKMIVDAIDSIDRVRFVSSGTEAVMSALRLARGFTGKNKILKFDGCYHGHSDCLLVNAGSGVAELSGSSSAGVPEAFVKDTISIPFNDFDLFRTVMAEQGDQIACVIVEPVPANMGVILPEPGFLELLREETTKCGALLIFDEVITGFRLCYGGYQTICGITPDLTTFGKIIGGGFPVGAFGGRAEIMAKLAPEGPVYQAGTLSGNPVAMTAGIATLNALKETNPYEKMAQLVDSFAKMFHGKHGATVNHIGGMFTIFHTDKPVKSFADAMVQDKALFGKRFSAWQSKNLYMPPSMYEAAFVSPLHTEEDLAGLL